MHSAAFWSSRRPAQASSVTALTVPRVAPSCAATRNSTIIACHSCAEEHPAKASRLPGCEWTRQRRGFVSRRLRYVPWIPARIVSDHRLLLQHASRAIHGRLQILVFRPGLMACHPPGALNTIPKLERQAIQSKTLALLPRLNFVKVNPANPHCPPSGVHSNICAILGRR